MGEVLEATKLEAQQKKDAILARYSKRCIIMQEVGFTYFSDRAINFILEGVSVHSRKDIEILEDNDFDTLINNTKITIKNRREIEEKEAIRVAEEEKVKQQELQDKKDAKRKRIAGDIVKLEELANTIDAINKTTLVSDDLKFVLDETNRQLLKISDFIRTALSEL